MGRGGGYCEMFVEETMEIRKLKRRGREMALTIKTNLDSDQFSFLSFVYLY